MKILKYLISFAMCFTVLLGTTVFFNVSAESNMQIDVAEDIETINETIETEPFTDEVEKESEPEDIPVDLMLELEIVDETSEVQQPTDIRSGWILETDGKRYYADEKGEYVTGYQTIDNKEYYFAANGVMKYGWYTINDSRMFFSPETGERMTGWVHYNENDYYIDKKGKYEGLKSVNGKYYIFDETGAVQNGWIEYQDNKYYSDREKGVYTGECEIDRITYLFSSKGKFKSDWQKVDGLRVFYDYETTKPIYGWINYNGNIYYSNEQEGKFTGDKLIDNIQYRFDKNGCLQLGFQKFGNITRYYDNNGKILIGFNIIEGKKYYFDDNGVMQTGFQTIANKKYYFDKNGIMQIGLKTVSGNTYYFNENGILQIGWQTINSKKYYFNENGIMQTGWQTIKNKKYYFNKKGIMQTGLQTIKDKKYYFNNNGVMQTGWQNINGKKYFFNDSGDMRTKIYKVFVGAGHGGIDSGAVKYIVEKEYTIKVAYIISEILYEHGVEYKLSREGDIDTTMESKLAICNNYNPDLIVDVHFNAGGNGNHGFEIYYSQYGGVSQTLAENIESEVKKIMYSNGIKTWVLPNGTDRFTLIREGAAPAVLCEGGFVDDAGDAEFIKNNYKKLAECYAKGILKTLGIEYKPK